MKKLICLAIAAAFVFAIGLTACGGGEGGSGGGAMSDPFLNPEGLTHLEGKWLALTGCFVMFTGNMIYEGGIDSGVARGYFTITGSKVNINWVNYTYDITADPVVWGALPGIMPTSEAIDYALSGDTLKWYDVATYEKMGPSYNTSNLNTVDMQKIDDETASWAGGGISIKFHDYRSVTEGGKTYTLLSYLKIPGSMFGTEPGGCALYSNGDIVFSPALNAMYPSSWKPQYQGTYTMPSNTQLNITIGGTTYNLTKIGGS